MNAIETRVLELIGEDPDSPDVFTDDSTGMAQVRDSINDAIEEICLVTGSQQRAYFIPLKSAAFFYQIDFNRDEFAWINSVWLHDQQRRLDMTDIKRLHHDNPRWLEASGPPYEYFLIGFDKIGVYPAPSANTDMLEVNCVSIPGRYELDTDRIKLRDEFQWAATHYAVGEYWASRGDAKEALKHHQEYMRRVGIQIVYQQTFDRSYRYRSQNWETGQIAVSE